MAALPIPTLKPQFCDENGAPLSGGKIWTYVAGTTTPAATYIDRTGSTPNSNPIVLDADGRADIFIGAGNYKFVVMDSADVVQFTEDDVTWDALEEQPSLWVYHSVTDGQAASNLIAETVDFADYSSAVYDVEIIRGTATFAVGQLSVQNVNGTGRVRVGAFLGDNPGVTFSVSQVGQVAQLKAALSTGPGSGTIKLRRVLIPT